MTDPRHKRGHEGEQQALAWLTGRGFAAIATNWRHHPEEIDIICEYKGELVFVEVKHRIHTEPVMAREALSKKQQKSLARAAQAYIEKTGWKGHARYDVIIITRLPDGKEHLEHIEEAFFPANV